MEMKKYKLSEICRIASSKRIFESEYVERGVPFIRGQEISDGSILDPKASFECYISQSRYEEVKEKYGKPNKGDILITAVGTIGNLCYLDKDIDFYFKDGNVIWFSEIISSCDGKFLFHFMKSSYFKEQLKYFMIGAVQKALTIDMLKKVEVPLPPLPTQQKIAAILSSLDDKIALNKKINAKLEAIAKRLYDYWFVQFDFPNEEGKPYKSSGGKMVWNEVLKREIPEGWEVRNLYEIADYINGLACQNYRPQDEEIFLPVIKIKEMHEGITSDTEKVSATIPEKYIIFDGDILFSWSATLEVMIWTGGKGGLNQHIFKVVPKSYFTKEYVFQQLSSYIVNFKKMAEARKTTMGHITSDHINQSRIVIPPKEVINAFSEKTLPIFNYQLTIQKEIQKLTDLHDRLLPLLMNGQVEVEG